MVSIMPGIETRAPLRTDTSSGFAGFPKPLPVRRSSSRIAARISAGSPSGRRRPAS